MKDKEVNGNSTREEINTEPEELKESPKEPLETPVDEEQTQSEKLQEDFDALEKNNKELEERLLRISSDFQNFRKRVEKEKVDIYAFANEKLICELLPVMDNFERAVLSAERESGISEKLLKGIEMVYRQLTEVLASNGVERIEALGQAFDPNVHHAVMQEELEEADSETVTEVFQTGYRLKSKVIRPSMVKVAK